MVKLNVITNASIIPIITLWENGISGAIVLTKIGCLLKELNGTSDGYNFIVFFRAMLSLSMIAERNHTLNLSNIDDVIHLD